MKPLVLVWRFIATLIAVIGPGPLYAQTNGQNTERWAPEPGEALWSVASSTVSEAAPDPGAPLRVFRRTALFIEGIEIVGNHKTARITIVDHLQVAVGDLVDEDAIEVSRLRLLGTGFFKAVEFSLRRGSQRGRVLLVVEVEERNTILIDEVFLGFSKVSPFFAGFGLAETNFMGRGVTVGGDLVLGENRLAFELRMFAPSLADTALQLSASARFIQGRELVSSDDPQGAELAYERTGGTIGLGFGVGAAQRVSLIYRLESVRTDRLPNLEPFVLRRAPSSIVFDDSVVSSLTAAYERDTRDDPFLATQGHRVALAVELGTALIGSTYEFSKYTVEAQYAFHAFSRHSLTVGAVGGLVQGPAPFFDRFFVADHASIPFGRNGLPRAVGVNFSEANDYDDLLASVNLMYAIPLFQANNPLFRLYLYGAVDVTVTASLDEFQEDPEGRGIGGFFPASVDLGLKIDTWIGNFTLSLAYFGNLVF